MKTKLFYLMLLLTVFLGKAQVNISEGFESGLPTGWTTDGYTNATTGCTGKGMSKVYSSSSAYGSFSTPNYTSNGNAITFSVDYKVEYVNSSSATVFVQISYTTNNNGSVTYLSNQLTGTMANCGTLSFTIPAGTVPAGSQIKFSFGGTRNGATTMLIYDNVVINQVVDGPTISNIGTSIVSGTEANVNYTIESLSDYTSVVKYGTESNNLSNQVTGGSGVAGTTNNHTTSLSGLQVNTTYYYVIEATNAEGVKTSAVNSFLVFEPVLLHEYNFNNTYNNVNGNTPFESNGGTSFTADRHGNAESALNINNTGTIATIPSLPYGNDSRTVSLWVKLNTIGASWNFLYSYGTGANPEGAHINPTTANHFIPNNQATSSHTTNTWYHYVFTYDGTTSKIYRDGALIKTQNVTKNTVNNSNKFTLGLTEGGGANYFNGTIDDLKIYNYALSDTEVANLYNSQVLSVTDVSKTQNVEIYPNPVNDILNIKTQGTVKLVEIFNTSGAKVKEEKSTTIDMKKLPTGIYMVKITDSEGKTNTKKIIKN